MGERFYNDNEDCAWLLDTALRGYTVPVFRSFILTGHEDCPLTIALYEAQDPTVDDTPVMRFTLRTDPFSNLGEYQAD